MVRVKQRSWGKVSGKRFVMIGMPLWWWLAPIPLLDGEDEAHANVKDIAIDNPLIEIFNHLLIECLTIENNKVWKMEGTSISRGNP